MILYSIIPPEIVFQSNTCGISGELEINYLGEKVRVAPLENNRYVIKQLLSTSPKAYLNPRLQPGVILEGGMNGMGSRP